MNDRKKVGNLGEEKATEYLKNKGYKILFRNYLHKWGDEIDIIAKDKVGILVFVEVKTLNNSEISELSPEDNLNFVKLRRLKRSCEFFANAHPELINDEGWRIDLVAVDIIGNNLTNKSSCEIRHYENI